MPVSQLGFNISGYAYALMSVRRVGFARQRLATALVVTTLAAFILKYAQYKKALVFPVSYRQSIQILHLSTHDGTLSAFETVASSISSSLEVTSRRLRDESWDTQHWDGHSFYNVTPQDASDYWSVHGQDLNTFHMIVVSDTAQLSRLVLDTGTNYKG